MSRLVVESYLTSNFQEKIFVRYGHRKDYKRLPGSCLLIMALETCNASVSHDIDGATTAFGALTLDSYPGENVSDFSTEALRLIKVMQGGYALPVNTGSRLLQKVTRTSCEEFNRKVFNLLDYVKTMEHKYKVLDPRSILLDMEYHKYGPVGVISTLQQLHGRLISDHDWPALAAKLPQSNNAAVGDKHGSRPSSSSGGNKEERKCYRCKGPHLIKDCPLKGKDRDKDTDAEPLAKKVKTDHLAAWKYLEPKDLTKPLVDEDNRKWKFCTKCVCKKSGKTGFYLLSHFDSEHKDDYTTPHEGNLASVEVPLGIPVATTAEPGVSDADDDPIEFRGAWCASVSASEAAHAFAPVSSSVERERSSNTDSTDDEREHHERETPASDAAAREDSGDPPSLIVGTDGTWSFPEPDTGSIPSSSVFNKFWMLFVAWEWVTYLSRRINRFVMSSFSAQASDSRSTSSSEFNADSLRQMFQSYSPAWLQQFAILIFWITLLAWECITYLATQCFVTSPGVPRRERRRLEKQAWRHRHDRGRRLPALRFLPILWMAMTNVILLPTAKAPSPIPNLNDLSRQMYQFGNHAYQRVSYLDELMVLDWNTWVQFNKLKATYLFQVLTIRSSSDGEASEAVSPSIIRDESLTRTTIESSVHTSMADCCDIDWWTTDDVIEVTYASSRSVHDFREQRPEEHHQHGCLLCKESSDESTSLQVDDASDPIDSISIASSPWAHELTSTQQLLTIAGQIDAHGPTVVETTSVTDSYGSRGYFDSPCAFMTFEHESSDKQPVIFDTGASLAITYDKADFDDPLTIPNGDLRLGGMANGLRIEGVGPVTYTFSNGENDDVVVRSMAYYVPKAKARLLSPQRLFDASTGMQGSYEGDQASFRLHLKGSASLIVEYDDRNSLPVGYARIGAVATTTCHDPQMNLSLMDAQNQNMTGGQKLLLHWHHRFGHLNFPAVQRILRAVPFLSAKFASASKCDLQTMKCAVCEFAKGHRRAKQSTTSVPNDQRRCSQSGTPETRSASVS
ncbi:hypothetical protein MHU86_1612 [Fragilaria crotonensis]|nr:hypothetical protein MHU86_1612 [Fragilaria crotonensis]